MGKAPLKHGLIFSVCSFLTTGVAEGLNKKGNTYHSLLEYSKTLKEEGIDSEIAWLGPNDLKGCKACGYCSKINKLECVYKDEVFHNVVNKLVEADGVVFASPVYFAGMSSSLKAFLDRAFIVCGEKKEIEEGS